MKNKKQKYFAQKRFTYFAEVPQFNEGELAEVKKAKGQEKEELNVGDLVNAVNGEVNKHADQLSDLPKEYLDLLHDEIRNYLLQSPGRYDKDTVKGLNPEEFKAYVADMQSKVAEIMKEWAPTDEEKQQLREAKNKAKEGAEKAEKIEPVNPEDIQENPGPIEDVQQLQTKYTEYDGWNASLQKEGGDALTATSNFQKSFNDYKKSMSGLSSYRKFGQWISGVFGSPPDEIDQLQKAQTAAKEKVDAIAKKYADSKEKLKKYGEALGNVSNTLKDKKVEERDEKLKKVKEKQQETDEQKKAREEKKKDLEERQKQMQGKKDEMLKYQDEMKKSKDLGDNRLETAKMKKEQLGRFNDVLKTSLERIDDALKNPNISDEQKKQLEEAKKTLQDKSTEADSGLKASDQVIDNQGQAGAVLEGQEKEAAQKSLALQQHLGTQVAPALEGLDKSIQALEDAKMQYATEEEQVTDYYGKGLNIYDNIDKAVDDAVLKNNLANEQISKNLDNSSNFLGKISVKGPGIWESTIGIIPQMVGGALTKFGEFCNEQSEWLQREVENGRKDMSTAGYVAARGGSEIVSFPIGTASALFEMAGGLLNMVGTPGDSLAGFGSLIGRDPMTGEWSTKTAGDSWKNMGKAIISYDDFSKGHIGSGLGKIFPNLVLALTGSSAVGAGSKAAEAAATVAREAGEGVLSTTGKAVVAFGKGALGDVADTATGLAKSTKNLGKNAGKFITGGEEGANVVTRGVEAGKSFIFGTEEEASGLSKLGQAAPGKLKEAIQATRDAVTAAPGKIAEIAGEGMEGLAAQAERLWGGKKFEAARLAKKQLGLVEDLGSKSGKYEEFQNAMKKLKEENPGLDDKQLRLKLSQQNLRLFTEGFQYEKELGDLEKAQQAFETAYNKNIKDPQIAESAKGDFANMKNAQKGLIDTAGGFNDFKKLVAKRDPQAVEAAQKYQEALAKGDQDALRVLKEQNPQWKDAFQNMDYRAQFSTSERNLAVFKMSDDIQYNVRTNGDKSSDYLEDLAKKAKTPEELDILDRAFAHSLKEGKANAFINRAIHEGKIPAGPQMVDTLIDLYGYGVLQMNNLEFLPKQQGKLLGKLMNFNGDPEPFIRQLIADNRIDLSNPETVGGLLKNPDKLNIAKTLIEEGKIDVANPKVINQLASNSKGAEMAIDLILEGKAPLTKEIFADAMDSEEALQKLEELIDDPKIKFEEGMTKEQMLKDIEWKREGWADQKNLREFRGDPKSPEYAQRVAELKEMFADATAKLRNGEPITTEAAQMLKRLQERDPEAYQLLLNSDTGRLIGNECFDNIISGNKIEFTDSNGQKVTAYNGKYLNEGGMGTVDHVAFAVPGGKNFEFGVIKKPHEAAKTYFPEEVASAKIVQKWDSPHLINPLHITDDFIIYETGERAMDLWKGRQVMSAEDFFKALSDTADGIIDYEKQGMFHGDIKEANVLVVQVGTDAAGKPIYKAKLIDNSPLDYSRASGIRQTDGSMGRDYIRTESRWIQDDQGQWNFYDLYAFSQDDFNIAHAKLAERGITGPDADLWLGRAADARAYGKMLEEGLDIHMPSWRSNPDLFQTVNSLKSPLTAGEPGMVQRAKAAVDALVADLENNPGQPVSGIISVPHDTAPMAGPATVPMAPVTVRQGPKRGPGPDSSQRVTAPLPKH